jgi:hypothetical protein
MRCTLIVGENAEFTSRWKQVRTQNLWSKRHNIPKNSLPYFMSKWSWFLKEQCFVKYHVLPYISAMNSKRGIQFTFVVAPHSFPADMKIYIAEENKTDESDFFHKTVTWKIILSRQYCSCFQSLYAYYIESFVKEKPRATNTITFFVEPSEVQLEVYLSSTLTQKNSAFLQRRAGEPPLVGCQRLLIQYIRS